MKRILSLLLSLIIVTACVPFTLSASAAWYDLTAIDGSSVPVTPVPPCEMNVIIFGRTTCYNTLSTLESLSDSSLPNDERFRFIYADIDGADRQTVADTAEQFSQSITFCYGDNSDMMWAMLNRYGTVSLPVIHFIDANGNVANTLTGYQSSDDIRETLGVSEPYQPEDDDPEDEPEDDIPAQETPEYIDAYVHGDFCANIQDALDRLNEIRYEACSEGVENPANPGHALTLDDYRPLIWSSDLETTARQRAAEAFVTCDHIRPNGKDCFSLEGEVSSSSEVLAWNSYSRNMVDGINQFYWEKSAWVNRTGGVTGHYTSMINPENRSVGLGLFCSDLGYRFSYSLCGRFSRQSVNIDRTFGQPAYNVTVKIEVKTEFIIDTGFLIRDGDPEQMRAGDTASLEMLVVTELDNYKGFLSLLDGVTWRSSDTNVFRVNDGVITAVGGGTATLTAAAYGYTAQDTVTVAGAPYQDDPHQDDPPEDAAILGDADGDGDLTVMDATRIQRWLAEKCDMDGGDYTEAPLTADELACADADGDGDVTIMDATAIQRCLAGLPTRSQGIGEPIG